MPKDDYLYRVAIDLDEADLNKVTGAIADEITKIGGISDAFVKNALDTAKKYNDEIAKQKKIIADIEKQLSSLDENDEHYKSTYKLLTDTKAKAEETLKKYTSGDPEKGMMSKRAVDALAGYAQQNEPPKSIKQKYQELQKGLDTAVGKFSAVTAVLTGVKDLIKKWVDEVSQILDNFSNIANQVNPLGAFGSSSQKGLMARYGLSGTQALGFAQAMDAMGISEGDFGTMTAAQRDTFNALNKFWNEGMAKLDPDKLENYTKTMERYQMIQAKFDMGMQQLVLKLISESPRFNEMVGKVGDMMDAFFEFANSEAVQFVFDGLIDFFTALFKVLEGGMRLLSGGGGSITTNNNTTNSNSTYNIYGSDFHSNDELARQISYSSRGGYKG